MTTVSIGTTTSLSCGSRFVVGTEIGLIGRCDNGLVSDDDGCTLEAVVAVVVVVVVALGIALTG